MYSFETWKLRKIKRKKMPSHYGLYCMACRKNQLFLSQILTGCFLEMMFSKQKLTYFRHVHYVSLFNSSFKIYLASIVASFRKALNLVFHTGQKQICNSAWLMIGGRMFLFVYFPNALIFFGFGCELLL